MIRGFIMIVINLSAVEISDINEAIDDPEISEKNKIKLLVIRMHSEGAKHGLIAKCLNLHNNTITNYLKEYQVGKLGAVLENKYYKPSSSLEPFTECIRCSFRAYPVADAKQAVARIEALTGIRLCESQARRFMKKLGMKARKSSSIPAKCDPQLQFQFYTHKMLPRLEEAAKGERKVMFVDAAHFVLGAFLGMLWCFSRILLKTSPGRQRYSVLGAIDSHNHELISIRTTGNINAIKVNELLDAIRKKHATIPITLIMDNARYQHCEFVKTHAKNQNIELLFLPTYSPNLNLIERLWKLTKKKCLTNKYYRNFGDFCHGIDHCLDNMKDKHLAELQSLLTLNFQFFGNHKT